jgi:hypothetical protein
MIFLNLLVETLEYLGGSRDSPPAGIGAAMVHPLFWGVWWGALLLLIYVFCGQSSKFIYIDF